MKPVLKQAFWLYLEIGSIISFLLLHILSWTLLGTDIIVTAGAIQNTNGIYIGAGILIDLLGAYVVQSVWHSVDQQFALADYLHKRSLNATQKGI